MAAFAALAFPIVVVLVVRLVIGVAVLILGKHEVGGMEERTFFGADVDERGLDAGEHCFDASEVDVADHAAGLGAVDQKFNELVVLDDGDPRFARVRVD